LDLYSPKSPRPSLVPGLIFIHGGGWQQGDKKDYLFYAVYYARRGYVVASTSYRLSGEAQYPAAVSDIKCAVRWMRANAARHNIDPNKLAVLGGSAGGHLAMMTGYTADIAELEGNGGHTGVSSRVQAVANFYGPCDLTVERAREAPECHAFFGKAYDEAPELYRQASPILQLTRDDPPTLIMHGTIDELVPIEQSDRLAKKLEELGIPCTYDRIEGWPHTMDMAAAINERFRFFIDRFLEKQFGILD
jgi:acetyl esterase/lipase